MSWLNRKSLFWESLSWLEVLMVLVVIAILAAILIPVRAGGGPSPGTSCLSNVKQIALMMSMYSMDHDERFPLRENWMESTYEYRKRDMWQCPVVAEEEKSKDRYGYAMNMVLSGAKLPRNPAEVPLVFESVKLGRNAFGTLADLPNPGRHNGKNMIGYADGHGKAVDPNKP